MSIFQSPVHCSHGSLSLRVERCDVIGIRRRCVTQDFCVDARPTFERMRQALDDKNTATLTEDKTRAIFVEGLTGSFGVIVIADGQRLHRLKPSQRIILQNSFDSPGNYHVRPAMLNQLARFSHRLSTGGTRC